MSPADRKLRIDERSMSPLLRLVPTHLGGLVLVEGNPFQDDRGSLERLFCIRELSELLGKKKIAQVNYSRTKRKGTVRGLHYQNPPYAETKFVRCLYGQVFDVAVDLRKGSPTFLQYHSEILSDLDNKTLVIPEGFAHGFQCLTDHCALLYFHTELFVPGTEGALNVKDPQLGIKWPLQITEISDRDRRHSFVSDSYEGVCL